MRAPIQPIAGTETFRLFAVPVQTVALTRESRERLGGIVDVALPVAGSSCTPRAGLHHVDAFSPLLELFIEQGRAALARDHVQHGALSVVCCVAEEGRGGDAGPFRAVPNAYLAGVYVARAPGDGCTLEFEDPRAQAAVLSPVRLDADAPDATYSRIEAPPGTLAVFPAYLRHRVVSAAAGSAHLVLRMGLMFQAFAETMARPKWQGNIQ